MHYHLRAQVNCSVTRVAALLVVACCARLLRAVCTVTKRHTDLKFAGTLRPPAPLCHPLHAQAALACAAPPVARHSHKEWQLSDKQRRARSSIWRAFYSHTTHFLTNLFTLRLLLLICAASFSLTCLLREIMTICVYVGRSCASTFTGNTYNIGATLPTETLCTLLSLSLCTSLLPSTTIYMIRAIHGL